MTLTHEDLPRKDGVPVGAYHLQHKLSDFAKSGFGFSFANGRTVEPITGRSLLRILYASGSDFTVEPADEDTARAIWRFLSERGTPSERMEEVGAFFTSLFAPTRDEEAERVAAEVAEVARQAREAEENALKAAALAAEQAAAEEDARLEDEAKAKAKAKADADELSKLEAELKALETAETQAPDAPSTPAAVPAPEFPASREDGAAVPSASSKSKDKGKK